MSEREDDELELQSLQRQLDDAFATTRPRRGYEDEVWLLIQEQRPVTNRMGAALAAFWQSVRSVPAAPAAAVASILVIAIGIGLFASNAGFGPSRGGGSTAQLNEDTNGRSNPPQLSAGTFGPLPVPGSTKGAVSPPQVVGQPTNEYFGPAQLVWAGTDNYSFGTDTAPVFRYQEPNTVQADQFAGFLGARLVDRQAGNLGYYSTSSYTLAVRGTVQTPPASPAYFIASVSIPPVYAAGASVQDIATIFLASHNLLPDWKYTVSVDSSHDPVKVYFERVFTVPGHGDSHLVDASGARSGLEVDITGQRPVLVAGPLPVKLDTAYYRVVSPAQAINASPSTPPSGPTIQLTTAEPVYTLVPAGDHSFYEPAFLLSGTFQLNGQTMVKHVVVPAIDPSQRAQ